MTSSPAKITDDAKFREGELVRLAKHQNRLLLIDLIEAGMRSLLAFLLVTGTFLVVAIGVSNHADPKDLSLLLTPLAGLAGLAVGYFFGQGGRTRTTAADLDGLSVSNDASKQRS